MHPTTPAGASGRTVVVGAGLAGLTAARDLARAGRDVIVVDKGRSVGGRLATRRMGDASLDHGAQFFTTRSPEFVAEVADWLAAGVAAEWCRGFDADDGYPRYRGAPSMNGVAKHLADQVRAAGAEIVTGRRAQSVIDVGTHWSVTYDGFTRVPDDAGSVILTPPTPQTIELLTSGGVALDAADRATLDAVGYEPVLALLVRLDAAAAALTPPDLGEAGARQWPDGDPFTFVADNAAKGVSAEVAITFHVSHARSRTLWDATDAEVWDELGAAVDDLIGPATIAERQVKRWRYAGPTEARPEPCLVARTAPGPLVVAGDGFADAKVEGAWRSGAAAAEVVLRHL
ncbi:MAG: NAD(P)/FAD-dependent oxidoreductase [Acidimicrobiales bacterium]